MTENERRQTLEKLGFPFDNLTKVSVWEWTDRMFRSGYSYGIFDHLIELAGPYISDLYPPVCPTKGEFIGYKIAYPLNSEPLCNAAKRSVISFEDSLLATVFCVVTLKIPEDARRSSAFDNKCRCDKAFVEKIECLIEKFNFSTNQITVLGDIEKACSKHDSSFIYSVGEMVKVDNFDTNRWHECAPGVHFFMAKEEAITYAI